MTVFRSRLIISTAAALALSLPAAAQMDTSFSNFVTHAPVLPPPVVSTDIVPVVRGGHTFQFALSPFSLTPTFETLTVASPPGTFAVNPANQTSSAISFATTSSGSVTSAPTDTGSMALVWFRQVGPLKWGGAGDQQIALFESDYVDTTTGPNSTQTFNGVIGNCNITTPKTGGGAPGTSCVGITAAARAWAPQGGTLGSESGGVHGLNVVFGLSDFGTTPTNYNNMVGGEADAIGCTGCTTKVRWGWGAIDFGDGFTQTNPTEKGSAIDAAFVVGSLSGPGYGWTRGLDFAGTPVYNGNPLIATGTLIGSSSTTPVVADYAIDLDNFVINQAILRGPGGNFILSGTGDVLAAGSINSLAGGMSINAAAASPAVLQFRSNTTPKWELTREATTNDLIISNLAASTIDFRLTAAGLVKLGNAGSVVVSTTGGVTAPGLSTSVGTIAGSVCADAGGILIYKVGANCI